MDLSKERSGAPIRDRSWLRQCAIVSCLAICGCGNEAENLTKHPGGSSQPVTLASAQAAFSAAKYERADELVRGILVREPGNYRAIVLAARIANATGDWESALDLAQSAWVASGKRARQALEFRATVAFEHRHLMAVVETMSILTDQFPDHAGYQVQATAINRMVGREEIAAEHARIALQRGQAEPRVLLLLCDTSRPYGDEEVCRLAVKAVPDDLRPLHSVAEHAAYRHDWVAAKQVLDQILELHPDYTPSYLLLGRYLLEVGQASAGDDNESLDRWIAEASDQVRERANFWVVLGRVLADRQQFESAARSFWRALKLDPSHADAAHRLAITLQRLDREEDAASVAKRARLLNRLREKADRFLGWDMQSQTAACDIARTLQRLGRIPEAYAWATVAMRMEKEKDPKADLLRRSIARMYRPGMGIQLPQFTTTTAVDMSSIPLPSLKAAANAARKWADYQKRSDGEPHGLDASLLKLEDQASQRGLDFRFTSGDDLTQPGMTNHESNGGGVGVIDYDLDGHPDLYLTTAGGQPLESEGSRPNSLFRNLNGDFQDVAVQAGVDLTAFNSGVAVGDFDQDGFPDLYVAAIGSNRLLRNNGDGTFKDVTRVANLELDQNEDENDQQRLSERLPADGRWTSSVVIADLDGDGLSDLYDTNYLAGRSTFRKRCPGNEPGHHSVCEPIGFPAEQDRVLLGNPDGSFVDVSNQWLRDVPRGRGLGVLAGNFDGKHGLDLFVANDMSANQYFHSEAATEAVASQLPNRTAPFSLIESAVLRGLAFDRYALSQACMGIAAGDPDGNGLTDLLVTNFYNEANTLYRQVVPGMWEDVSYSVGLDSPSRDLLGFGCHFVDFDNDGDLELFVTNGHIDDLTDDGKPFQMPAQLVQQVGPRRGVAWQEVDFENDAGYMSEKHLGRSVAVLDLNRDGRQDLCISDLIEPVALLVNQTPDTGHWIRLKLAALNSHRDAVGTSVSWDVSGERCHKQLYAGNGYQCANQGTLHLPVGDVPDEQTLSVQIVWPSGDTQSMSVSAGNEYLVVEGQPEPFAY